MSMMIRTFGVCSANIRRVLSIYSGPRPVLARISRLGMLTSSNTLVLDGAIAPVNMKTDAALQQTLRSDIFKNRTIITISQWINSIIDSDRIPV
ncbi:hypothetical protein PENARI_c003G01116 [Penicillium arizonense]|uniref:Uncharacterized protein n=1 Tax=Penicillium arizonense TaxID=1835702 RepID=A0A1F5LSX6_PENAI|nr:hypothetical protein PENARI_c003G01116 [Penicillium arizonense]OGE56313.1 hypothetical protein PENARI_c003G01116 [Penicillium arizonense]